MKKFLFHFQKFLAIGIILCSNCNILSSGVVALTTTDPPAETTEESTDPPDNDTDPPTIDPAPPIFHSDLIIKAFHPGYDLDKTPNVGEFIELLNLTDASLELAGYSLVYTGSGKPSPVFTFSEGSYLTGKHLLLRYSKSPETDFDLSYTVGTKGLAKNGKLELFYGEDLVDSVCWGTKTSTTCSTRTNDNEAVVRDLTTGKFDLADLDAYEFPEIDPDNPNLILPPEPEPDPEPEEVETLLPQCRGLEFSELLTYYEQDKSEQFIELFNPTGTDINLSGCKIGFKNKTYVLSGKVPAGGYYAYFPSSQFAFTKNPKNPLAITLIDADDEVLDEITYSNGQKKSTSLAKVFLSDGGEIWQITYAITPGTENIYQKFRSCEAGKVINEATGNCVKVTTSKSATETLQSKAASLAACPAGKYRNPLTGRCKTIETASSTLKPCAEGYERNPETNRCRKVASTTPNNGTDYALTPTVKSDKTVFIGIGIVALIIAIGVVYIILQFRREILRAARKARQRLNYICKNLLARKIGRHRHQKS